MFPVNDSVDNEFNYAVMSVYFEVRNCTQCYAAAACVYLSTCQANEAETIVAGA